MPSEWISVKDELPPPNEPVLVWFADDFVIGVRGGYQDVASFHDRYGWCVGERSNPEHVTHWARLPPPPEAGAPTSTSPSPTPPTLAAAVQPPREE